MKACLEDEEIDMLARHREVAREKGKEKVVKRKRARKQEKKQEDIADTKLADLKQSKFFKFCFQKLLSLLLPFEFLDDVLKFF